MGDVRALENHRFRRELVQVRRMDLYASVTSQRICALLVRQKQYQVWLSWCGHELRVRSKSAVAIDCNDSTVTVAVRATRTLVPGSARGSRAHFGGLAEIRQDKKVRDREAAIASTRAACAPRKVSRRNIHPSSVSSSG